MSVVLHRTRLGEHLPPTVASPTAARWRLAEDGLSPDDSLPPIPARSLVAVPSEQVLLLAVELPIANRRRRLEALPFAIEDRIADPLEMVHVALGEELAPGRFLAAVVRHERMAAWVAALAAAEIDDAALVPDALLLPRPAPGRWTVAAEAERTLVRQDDGTGFAIASGLFAAAWAAGGRPAIGLMRGELPEGVPGVADVALGDPVAAPPIDLLQGRYAVRRRSAASLWRKAGWIAAAGIAAHGAIAAADTLMLRSMAAKDRAQTRLLLGGAAPADDASLASVASDRLAQAAPAGGMPDRMLPLLSRVSAALGPGGAVGLRGIGYDAANGRIELTVDAGAEAALATRLSTAGLAAVARPGRVIVAEARG